MKKSSSHSQLKIRSKLGLFLKENRKKVGLSQIELANQLGYETPQFISDWERGIYSPPMKKLLSICSILKIKPAIFFKMILEFSQDRLQEDMLKQYKNLRKS